MGTYVQIDENNIVVNGLKVSEENETLGINFIINDLGFSGTWLKTSFNTLGGKHYNSDGTLSNTQDKAFRKNYGNIGFTYDEQRDAFIPPKPYPSWILNEDTCQWDAPVSRPNNIDSYDWDENTLSWVSEGT
jgi:hypothetical protein